MLLRRTHLKVGAEPDDALQVCTAVTQNVLSTQQRDLIAIDVQLQPRQRCTLIMHTFKLRHSRPAGPVPVWLR